MTYIADQIKNVTYLPTILDYVEMITYITINRDKEITKSPMIIRQGNNYESLFWINLKLNIIQ